MNENINDFIIELQKKSKEEIEREIESIILNEKEQEMFKKIKDVIDHIEKHKNQMNSNKLLRCTMLYLASKNK